MTPPGAPRSTSAGQTFHCAVAGKVNGPATPHRQARRIRRTARREGCGEEDVARFLRNRPSQRFFVPIFPLLLRRKRWLTLQIFSLRSQTRADQLSSVGIFQQRDVLSILGGIPAERLLGPSRSRTAPAFDRLARGNRRCSPGGLARGVVAGTRRFQICLVHGSGDDRASRSVYGFDTRPDHQLDRTVLL